MSGEKRKALERTWILWEGIEVPWKCFLFWPVVHKKPGKEGLYTEPICYKYSGGLTHGGLIFEGFIFVFYDIRNLMVSDKNFYYSKIPPNIIFSWLESIEIIVVKQALAILDKKLKCFTFIFFNFNSFLPKIFSTLTFYLTVAF